MEVLDVAVRRRRRLTIGIIAAATLALAALQQSSTGATPQQLKADDPKTIVDLGDIQMSGTYDAPSSLKHYPFENATFVEPHRAYTLAVGNKNRRIAWRVSEKRTGEELASWTAARATNYTFATAGKVYVVEARDQSGNRASIDALCKYVRREVRSLSADDRERFLRAVAAVYATPTVEGQRLYGKDFRNGMSWFARWHLGSASAMNPWHGGPSFFPSHAMLTRYFERALQSVEPSTAAHYWDWSVDASLDDWSASDIWTADFFGPVGRGGDSPVVHGRWANVTSPQGLLGTTTNSYGILNEPYNNNRERRLTRTFELCGLPSKAFPLPGCAALASVVDNRAMDQGAQPFEVAAQINYHFELHPLLGGSWDCAVNAKAFVDEERTRGDGANATDAYVAATSAVVRDLASFVLMNFYTSKMDCPDACDANSDAACRCSCQGANLDAPMDGAQWYSLFVKHVADVMYDIPSPEIVMPFTYELLYERDGAYEFKNLTEAQNERLYEFFVKEVCAPPSFSNFASALASAGDPIFFPVHANYERVWTALRLDKAFDSSWNISGMAQAANVVTGYRYDDPLEPFTEAYGHTREPPGSFYTNREIVALFDPKLPTLPFVYEDLDWDHCSS